MFRIALTDHLEGPAGRPSADVFGEVAEVVTLADRLGVDYAFFTEHHAHAHLGHLPTPLLFALHLAARTTRIRLGTAVICTSLHNPLDVAEQVAVADLLTAGRIAPGFGSGTTPAELALFDQPDVSEDLRHAKFESSLRTILVAWSPESSILPRPLPDLPARAFCAVNSEGAARVAGRLNLGVLFSHLRTPDQYRAYTAAYRAAGGSRLIAANRPVYVGPDDATALADAERALRTLWRRFRAEGKIPADTPEPADPRALCAHPINFIVGGPHSVADQLRALHAACPFDLANLEFRWADLTHAQVLTSLERFMTHVTPLLPQTR